eukprot:NODE_5296_length_281_cov_25.245690_g4851_i0.p2 GENE.NODE_5296_length_281_cov_25.245690_g4851_i0~~NODE_5296_length_281_cov_25.245690_g4851_i0.p2  ORF type:complete len:51 (+),score=7.40 NODE_5296_length_281_cov_25.245690_g4851_i0:23-154(+)
MGSHRWNFKPVGPATSCARCPAKGSHIWIWRCSLDPLLAAFTP